MPDPIPPISLCVSIKTGGADPVPGLFRLVSRTFHVPEQDLRAPSRRTASAARARQVCMYLMNVALGMTFVEVGRALGRDRTTAAHAARLVEERRDDPAFDALIDRLEHTLMAEGAR
ncbi:helix-turn-helix domain-containing protein [Futiania mangrovi]|uniref:Chromosomal replication initiator DnaA n=1 Tax=Futiania mangrovi TaxID=2959716 RepID=A0A9J6PFU1_9PROT|nr:helix-turn-helix domain-containing protein [Futiania mangrovii]MCP1337342.1 chromosomal replication initiator DnaA [Futiania mangrovii]